MRLAAFCEAPADFRLASGLIDRVLRDHGPGWVVDNLDQPDAVRSWQPDGHGREFFKIHDLDKYVVQWSVRVPHGHFDGRPGGAGSLMARTVFRLARTLERSPGTRFDGVVLMTDMDDDGDARRSGLEAARAEAQALVRFEIVLGSPDPKRETWVLAGFDPVDDAERDRLDELRRELGFSPTHEAERLRAKRDHESRSAKRVLAVLTNDDQVREERCWTEASLETLRARGSKSGLVEFLHEVRERLLPLFGRQ